MPDPQLPQEDGRRWTLAGPRNMFFAVSGGPGTSIRGPLLELAERVEVVPASLVAALRAELVALDAERLQECDARVEAEAEVARLTARTHEIAEAGDRKNAALESEVAKYKARYEAARERTKDWPVDWTNDLPSQAPFGWWRYTSQNHVDEVVALIEAVRAEAVEQERRRIADSLRTTARLLAGRRLEGTVDALLRGLADSFEKGASSDDA